MAEHRAVVIWSRNGAAFTDQRYSRLHRWLFDGGVEVAASASPHVVPAPLSVEQAVDPEEAFVASVSSCHMLWFLSIAAQRGYIVESYRDDAVGILEPDESGRLAITRVTLHPDVQFAEERRPTDDETRDLHDEAHAQCFIARSVRAKIRCEPI